MMLWLAIALALAVLGAKVIALFHIDALWDDAYIFQRYVGNLLSGRGWAWNLDGEPTYGTTSLAFVLPATAIRTIVREPSLAAMLASVSGGVVFIGLLVSSLQWAPGNSVTRLVSALLATLFGAMSPLAYHFTSGMDTTWCLAFLAAYFWMLARRVTSPTRRGDLALGAFGGLAFAVRPDLIAFTLGVPALWAAFAAPPERRAVAGVLAMSAAMTVAQLGFNAWYFRSALPLSFYAKSTGLYGEGFSSVYADAPATFLWAFARAWWLPLLLIAASVAMAPRRSWQQLHPAYKGVALSTLGFSAYYAFLALHVMGYHARFYQPIVVPIVWLLAIALARAKWLSAPSATIGVAWFGLAASGALFARDVVWQSADLARAWTRTATFDVRAHAGAPGPSYYWWKMKDVAELPDDVVLAATEVGMLSAVNPNKRIIDMAGLNDRDFAHNGFDADQLLRVRAPDLIYMPHVDYAAMRAALTTSTAWTGYLHFDHRRLGTKAFGIAVRRDSKHFGRIVALLRPPRRH